MIGLQYRSTIESLYLKSRLIVDESGAINTRQERGHLLASF